MTTKETRALIAEARAAAKDKSRHSKRLLNRLASALEARQVDEAALREEIDEHLSSYTRFPHTYEAWHGCSCGEQYEGHPDGRIDWLSQHRARAVIEFLGERHEPERVEMFPGTLDALNSLTIREGVDND